MKELTAYDLSALKVLIVDDNPHMRYLVRQLLGAFGIRQKHEAVDGADALKCLSSFQADFAICDWNMTPLDGLEFTRLVRTSQDTQNPFLPIIMLTGHTELHRVEEARDAGVDEFLSKPISATALYERIVSVIEKRRPFVRCTNFLGPDRRRRRKANPYSGPERRFDGELDEDRPASLFGKTAIASHHPN